MEIARRNTVGSRMLEIPVKVVVYQRVVDNLHEFQLSSNLDLKQLFLKLHWPNLHHWKELPHHDQMLSIPTKFPIDKDMSKNDYLK